MFYIILLIFHILYCNMIKYALELKIEKYMRFSYKFSLIQKSYIKMSRRRISERPMWRFANESDKAAVAIPYKLLYENGRAKYHHVPSIMVLPVHLIGAGSDVLTSAIESCLSQYNDEGTY